MQIRSGEVCELDYAKCLARVEFKDMDNFISAWLQVGQRGTLNNKDYWMPEIGEQVICALGDRTGSVMYAVYNDIDLPAYNSEHIRGIKFSDDTEIFYDRDKNKLVINIQKAGGEVNFTADKKVYHSKDVDIKAENSFKVDSVDVNINGKTVSIGESGGTVNVKGSSVSIGDVANFGIVHTGCPCLFLGAPHQSPSPNKTS